jgi:hypothetical protein
MKGYKEAKKEFNKVLLAPIPAVVRKNVNKFLKMIDNKQNGYILNNIAIFGLGWDNNVENTANPFLFNGQLQSNEKKDDYSFKTILVSNLIVPIKGYDKLTSESTGVLYLQEQKDVKTSNLFVASLSTGLGLVEGKSKTTGSLTYDSIWIDGIDSIVYYGLDLKVRTKVNKTDMFNVNVKLKEKVMIQEDEQDKDSEIFEIGLGYNKTISKDRLSLNATLTNESKKRGTRVDIDKVTVKYKVGYDMKLIPGYGTSASYTYAKTNYSDMKIINSSDKRADELNTITLKVTKPINKSQSVSLELNDIQNKSNHDAYKYDKQSIAMNYTIKF